MAQSNPFSEKKNFAKSSAILQKSTLWHTITKWQKDMNSKLTSYLKEFKTSFKFSHLLILLGISLAFGVIHAIGPGHGKMIIGTYFLKEKASPIQAVKIGSAIAVTHSGLAILLGIIFGIIIKNVKMNGRINIENYIGIASGILITVLGIYYLWQKLSNNEHFYKISKGDNGILLGIFSGLVPCPISMAIILFSLYLEVFFFGLISVIFFSIGMAITISLIGITMIKSRNIISKIPVKNKEKTEIFQKVFGIVTSILIIMIGLSLIIAKF